MGLDHFVKHSLACSNAIGMVDIHSGVNVLKIAVVVPEQDRCYVWISAICLLIIRSVKTSLKLLASRSQKPVTSNHAILGDFGADGPDVTSTVDQAQQQGQDSVLVTEVNRQSIPVFVALNQL